MFVSHSLGTPKTLLLTIYEWFLHFITGESSGNPDDNTGTIAGGTTGGILFITLVVVILLLVQRRILKNQHETSVRVKMSNFKYTFSAKKRSLDFISRLFINMEVLHECSYLRFFCLNFGVHMLLRSKLASSEGKLRSSKSS